MLRSLGEGFRTGAFRTAAAFAVLLLAAVAAASFSSGNSALSQPDTPGNATVDAPDPTPSGSNPLFPASMSRSEVSPVADILSDKEVALSIVVLLFAIIVISVVLIAFRKHLSDKSEEIGRFGIVTILISGALFLITAGFSNTQIAPAYGLLGTIAGYLLGQGRAGK